MKTIKRGQPQTQVLLKHGVRSGLEDTICKALTDQGIPYEYETLKIKYRKPEREHTYTPDIILNNGIIIESKGRFVTADRQKHLLVKAQHPDLDIRFVFSNSRARISKRSTTTYGMWADKHGFLYSDKVIPDSWIKEKKNVQSKHKETN